MRRAPAFAGALGSRRVRPAPLPCDNLAAVLAAVEAGVTGVGDTEELGAPGAAGDDRCKPGGRSFEHPLAAARSGRRQYATRPDLCFVAQPARAGHAGDGAAEGAAAVERGAPVRVHDVT